MLAICGRCVIVSTCARSPRRWSVAEQHFRVEKIEGDPTHTRIKLLDDAERRDELQRMLGGLEFLTKVGR